MKKSSRLLNAIFLIILCFSAIPLNAQEKTATEKEQQLKLQQAIDLQKKALAEQKKAQEQALKELERLRLDTIRGFGRGGEGQNFYRSRVRSSGNLIEGFEDPMVITGGQGGPGGSGYSVFLDRRGDSERTTWDYSKQVKESTYSNELSFDVDKTATSVSMSLMGDCKSGQIRVKIVMPNGKVYSDIVIDESGNLNWRKTFTISEEQNKDKSGQWKFKIEAEKASGYFKISLQTN